MNKYGDLFSPVSEYSDVEPQSFTAKLLAHPEISGLPTNALGISSLVRNVGKAKSTVEGLPAMEPTISDRPPTPPRKTPPRKSSPDPPTQPPRPPSIHRLPLVIKEPGVPSVQVDHETKLAMHNIESSVIRIEGQGRRHGEGLNALQDRIDTALKNIQQQKVQPTIVQAPPPVIPTLKCDQSGVMKKLVDVQSVIAKEFPELRKRLDDLQIEIIKSAASDRSNVISMKNVAPPSPKPLREVPVPTVATISQLPDFSELETKLDCLLTLCQNMQEQRIPKESEPVVEQPDEKALLVGPRAFL